MDNVARVTPVDDLSDFPVSDYYKEQVVEARTISRSGLWWSAILLIRDPKTSKPFLAFYRWQKRDGDWKVRKSFKCGTVRDARKIIDILQELSRQLA